MIKNVVKSNGQVVAFEPERLNKWGEWADKYGVCWSEVVLEAVKRCHDGCSTKDLHQAMIDVCIDKQSQNYSDMAGRLLLGIIYKEAFGGFSKIPTLESFYKEMVAKSLWEEMDYSEEELKVLAGIIEHGKDLTYGYAVLKQFRDKYGIKDIKTDKLYESPQFMFLGMAMKAFENQPKERRIEDIKKLYTYLSDLKINAPTPYLNGLRARKTGYASCCLIKANDTADSIGIATHIAYEMTTKQAGIGMFMNLRSIGDGIRNGTIEHMGKLGYYRMIKDAVQANKQKSRGGSANVFYTMLDPQIEDLLRLKHPTTASSKRINEIDYGVIMGDAFLDAVKNGLQWPLVSVKDAPELYEIYIKGTAKDFINAVTERDKDFVKRWVDARELMLIYVNNRVATGRVYPAFSGNMNRHTPFNELLPMSNLCMEVVLPVYGFEDMCSLHSDKEDHNPEVDGEVALCFLASLVAGRISKEEYEDVAYYALAMVDSVMDEMDYPFPAMKRTVQARRSVGIGLTNVAHYMASNYVTYSSRAGKTLLHELAEMHSYYLHKASLRLSKERGLAEWIGKTKYVDGWVPPHTANKNIDSQHDATLQFDWEELSRQIKENGGIRNSVLEAYMPNESSSLATNTTNGLYPIRDFILTKKSSTGNVLFIVPDYDKLKYMYEIAWNIPTRDLIDCYAIVQKFTGQAISADFYINYSKLVGNRVSAKEFMMDTLYAWLMGMKTQYYVNSMVGVGSSSLQETYCEGCGV